MGFEPTSNLRCDGCLRKHSKPLPYRVRRLQHAPKPKYFLMFKIVMRKRREPVSFRGWIGEMHEKNPQGLTFGRLVNLYTGKEEYIDRIEFNTPKTNAYMGKLKRRLLDAYMRMISHHEIIFWEGMTYLPSVYLEKISRQQKVEISQPV